MDRTPCGAVTLTTDYGLSNLYVGVMKGVILNINPQVQIADITQAIPPQDIHGAAVLIDSAYRYFPPGTIHVVIVDPGGRAPAPGYYLPNRQGVLRLPRQRYLSHIHDDGALYRATVVESTTYCLPEISNTFHGRDIFAAVAAHLSCGVPLGGFGPPVDDLVQSPYSHASRDREGNHRTYNLDRSPLESDY